MIKRNLEDLANKISKIFVSSLFSLLLIIQLSLTANGPILEESFFLSPSEVNLGQTLLEYEVSRPEESPSPQNHGPLLNEYARILHGDKTAENISFVILADGYTENEKDKFFSDSTALSKELFSNDTFSPFEDNINIYGIMTFSPHSTLYKTSPIISSYFSSESPRKDIFLPRITSLSYNIPGDYYIVLINSKKFLGVTILPTNPNHQDYTVVYISSDFEERSQNLLHELGHAIGKLGDEYHPIDRTPYHIEAPNLTRNSNNVPWKSFLDDSEVGVHEVPGTGWYRPTNDCIMMGIKVKLYPSGKREFVQRDYCMVCSQEISIQLEEKIKETSLANYAQVVLQ
jgi:hypothetical protein